MTEKELLYVEDILDHLKNLEDICNYYVEDVDDDMKEILQNISDTSNQEYKKIYNLL